MDAAASGPIRVAVTRGGVVEAVHDVHAVAVRHGTVVAGAGDTGLVNYFRSSAKPFQALPLVCARDDLTDDEIAIACASHLADPRQLAAVRSLLAKAGASEADLECGPEAGSRLNHNCSGKHAGMLALCRARSWPTDGYRLPDHPVQQAMLAEVAAAAEVPAAEIPTAADGCGVVTFGLPLVRMALAFGALERREGAERVAAAMRARPELIRGEDSPDTMLMRALPGWIAKGGAEGLFCAAASDGLGVALKVADGGGRAVNPALAAFLGRLGYDLDGFARMPVRNSRGDLVGEIRTA